MTKEKEQAVLILDIHRGIYFGYLKATKNHERTVVLERARQAYYYTTKNEDGEKGVYALATSGPQDGSKIGPRVTITVHDVGKIVECTELAIAAWEKQIWK